MVSWYWAASRFSRASIRFETASMAGVRVSRAASTTSLRVSGGVVGVAGWRGIRGMALVSAGWSSGLGVSVVGVSAVFSGVVVGSAGWTSVLEPMVRMLVSVATGCWGEASGEVAGPRVNRRRASRMGEMGLRVIGQRF